MASIAVVHIGLAGHVARNSRLGAELVRLGHVVHAWAPAAQSTRLRATGATVHEHEPLPVSSIGGGGAGFAAGLAEATERHVETLIHGLHSEEIEVVVHDYTAPWGRVAADYLGLPAIASYPLVPGLQASTPEPADRPPLVPALPPGWELSLARARAAQTRIGRRWGVDLDTWNGRQPTPEDWAISFTVPDLVEPDDVHKRWRFVGPLLDAGSSGCQTQPPSNPSRQPGPPLVYVSLGTFFNFVPDVLRAVIEALGDEPLEVVVSTGRGPIRPEHLAPLPANVTVHEFVVARELLARAAVTVTHCGSNSVHEALIAGVPMVCLPQAADQFGWARRVERAGAGIVAQESAASIRHATRSLLDDPRPRERARRLGEQLTDYDGAGEVARLIRDALG